LRLVVIPRGGEAQLVFEALNQIFPGLFDDLACSKEVILRLKKCYRAILTDLYPNSDLSVSKLW